MLRRSLTGVLAVGLAMIASPAWSATSNVAAPAAVVRPANEGVGCTLSGWHAVAGDLVPAASVHAAIAYGASARVVDPIDSNYHDVSQLSTVHNNSSSHALFQTRWVIGHVVLQQGNTTTRWTTTYDGTSTFVGTVAPTGTWAPRANPTPTLQPTANDVSTSLSTMRYGDMGIPATGILSTLSVSVDPDATVPAFEIGTIGAGLSVPTKVSAVLDRPQNTGSYGWSTTDAIVAKTCLPDPTVASWVNGSGLTPITGTGDYAGDTVTITTQAGAVLGTAVVQSDLTWSFTPTTALPAGETLVSVSEVDEYGLSGSSSNASLFVAVPGVTLSKTTAGQSVTAAPGPEIVTGGPTAWTFTATNTGNVALEGVSVADVGSDGVPVTVVCPKATLAVAEAMVCHATGTAVLGQYHNTATVGGNPVDSGGNAIANTTPVSAVAQSWYMGVRAGLTLVKTANVSAVSVVGAHITYSFTVTNTGTGRVTGLAIADQLTAPAGPALAVSCPTDSLDAGQVVTCTGTYVVTQADLSNGGVLNSATASGTIAGQNVTSTTSTVRVRVETPPGDTISIITGVPGAATPWWLVITGSLLASSGGVVLLLRWRLAHRQAS